MLDNILKSSSLITVFISLITVVFGFIKYLDQRNREERTRRFELYHGLMRTVSAFGKANDDSIPLTQQLAAIYELQHFNDYAYASVPILEHLREVYMKRECPSVLMRAIDQTLRTLRNQVEKNGTGPISAHVT
jgi:hypothetical protein